MTQLSNLLPDAGRGMTISEFEALRQQRKNMLTCSGYIEPGNHYVDASNAAVNEGIWCTISGGIPNGFRMGRGPNDSTKFGTSDTHYPIYNVDGIRIVQDMVGAPARNTILLPPAPDPKVETSTTTTRDYERGDHVVVGNDIYVCTHGSSPAGMLLTDTTYFKPVDMVSREDLVGLEVFLVEVGDDEGQIPAVYPYGNVQNNGDSTNTKGYTDGEMPQSYSAFGDWDKVTWGRGFTWSKLTEEQKTDLLNNPDNNLYRDGDRVFQWQYRVRVFPSVGEDWLYNSGFDYYANNVIRQRGNIAGLVASAQGQRTEPLDYNSGGYFYQVNSLDRIENVDGGVAVTRPHDTFGRPVYWMAIAKVTRMNQGAYHPIYNALGTLLHAQTVSGGSTWDSSATGKYATSVADCFLGYEHGGSRIRSKYGGNIQHGASGHPLRYNYDNIYDWQVEDLRISAHGIDPDAGVFGSDLMSGRYRGWEYFKGIAVMRGTLAVNDFANGEFSVGPSGTIAAQAAQRKAQGGCWVYNVDKNEYQPAVKVTRDDRDDLYYYLPDYVSPTVFENKYYTHSSRDIYSLMGNKRYESWDVNDNVIIIMPLRTKYSFEQLPVTEVFSKPDVLVDLLDSFGVDYAPGLMWSPVLPDDTSKTQALTRRVVAKDNHLTVTQDNGATWYNNNTYTATFNNEVNAGSVTMPADAVMMLHYAYSASVVEPMSSAERRVLASTELDHVFIQRVDGESTLIPSLIGKVGPGHGGVVYSKHVLERAVLEYNVDEGSVFETSWSDNVIRHTESTLVINGDCVKFAPFLSKDLVEGLVYGSLTFRELKYDADPKTITEVDLSTSATHGLGVYDRFVIKNCSNPAMNNIVFIVKFTPDTTWDNNSFDGYTINYEDGSVYKPDGTVHGTFHVDPNNKMGDDNAMQYYQNITFMTNLNGYRISRGLSRTRRPLGFLPKEKR